MDLSLIRAARPFLPDLAATRLPLPVWARRFLQHYGTYRPPIDAIPLPLTLSHPLHRELHPWLLHSHTVGELSSGMLTWEQGS